MHFFNLATAVLLPLTGLVSAQGVIDLKPYQCVAHPRPDPVGACGIKGHVAHWVHGWKTHHLTQEQCATLCTCNDSQCKSFAWRPHHHGSPYGPCTIFNVFLEQTAFRHGSSLRTYWDRTCYNRHKPTSTSGVQHSPTSSHNPYHPPPPPYHPPPPPYHPPRAVPAAQPEAPVFKRSVVVEQPVAMVAERSTEFENGILDALS